MSNESKESAEVNGDSRSLKRVVGEQRTKALSDLRQLVAWQMTIPGWNAAARGAVGKLIKEKRDALDALLSNKKLTDPAAKNQ